MSPVAVAASDSGIDDLVNRAVQPLTTFVSSVIFFSVPILGADVPLVVVWLVAGAVFFTVYFGFINVRGFRHALKLVRGDYSRPEHSGEVSHFQALATAVSGPTAEAAMMAAAVDTLKVLRAPPVPAVSTS